MTDKKLGLPPQFEAVFLCNLTIHQLKLRTIVKFHRFPTLF